MYVNGLTSLNSDNHLFNLIINEMSINFSK